MNPTDKAMRKAVPLPEPTCDEVQFVFERWLEQERPSGDGEDVQRQWERSGAHADLYETFSLKQLLSYGDAREAAALASSAAAPEQKVWPKLGDTIRINGQLFVKADCEKEHPAPAAEAP